MLVLFLSLSVSLSPPLPYGDILRRTRRDVFPEPDHASTLIPGSPTSACENELPVV